MRFRDNGHMGWYLRTFPTLITLVHNGKELLCFSFSQLSKLRRISVNIQRVPGLYPPSQTALASDYPCKRSSCQRGGQLSRLYAAGAV
jgi:hypothetical protein